MFPNSGPAFKEPAHSSRHLCLDISLRYARGAVRDHRDLAVARRGLKRCARLFLLRQIDAANLEGGCFILAEAVLSRRPPISSI